MRQEETGAGKVNHLLLGDWLKYIGATHVHQWRTRSGREKSATYVHVRCRGDEGWLRIDEFSEKRALEVESYDVDEAADGEEGVAMVQSRRPDLVLMDMSLPVIDGWEATRQIKANPDTKAIPVIALTAHAMQSDRDKAMDAGCDDFYTKPIELPGLLEIIEKLLDG